MINENENEKEKKESDGEGYKCTAKKDRIR